MTALGFAVQTGFFEEVADKTGFLGDMATAFGLIGFAIIALMIGRIPFLQILSWLIITLILVVRPLGEPLFFVNLNDDNAPELYQGPAMGGQLTQEEYALAVGDAPDGQTFMQRMNDRGYPSITAFTPQIAAISTLNKINAGLSNQFLAPGHRTLDGFQPAINAIKRGRLASDSSNFHLGQFLSICAADDAGAAQRLAATYTPFAQLEEQGSEDIIRALQDRKLSGWDAWVLFNQYDGYAQRQGSTGNASLTLPPLVCPADGCGGEGTYTVTDRELIEEVLRPITVSAADDFTRIRDTRRQVLFDTHAMTALLSDNVEGIQRRMREQKLSMAVPLNTNSIAAEMSYESAEDGAYAGFDIAPYIEVTAVGLTGGLGCIAGAKGGAMVGAVGAGATVVGAWTAPLTAGAGAILGCAGGALAAAFFTEAAIPETWEVNLGVGDARNVHPEKVFVVETCADFHRLTDARLFVDTALSNRLTETIADIMRSGDLPNDFSQMNAEDQVMVALQSALAAQSLRCGEYETDADVESYQFSSQMAADCQAAVERNSGELIAFAQMAAANNTLPSIMASIHADNATSVRQIGAVRQAMTFGGEMFALTGVELRAIWGGFEAGTYAKIMPFIVNFGTAITVMITPFLYMIGLLVPQWSLSILLIPIVGVVYFQMVKVVFTVINILGATFLDAHELGLLRGTDTAFADIIMGTAYTMAFILSAGLLFALRNPGAIIQNVAGMETAVQN